MIKHLRIRNFALIRDLSLDLSPGLTVLTGETGAGKSMLVDSLALLLGERAAPEMIRFGESSAAVEAVFDLERHADLLPLLSEKGWMPAEGSLVLRREILAGGRSRAFLAEHPVSLADLRRVAASLVDLHGQHEHQVLLRASEHLAILDGHAEQGERLGKMAAAWESLLSVRRRLEALEKDAEGIARRLDFLKYQVDEIERAALEPGEMEALRAERLRLRNLEKIGELSRAGVEALHEGEVSALGLLEAALGAARELARLDPGLDAPLSRGEEAKLALQDLAAALSEAQHDSEDPLCRLEEIEARMASLEALFRKYGSDEAAVLDYARRSREEYESFTGEEHSAERLAEAIRLGAERCSRLAGELSSKRRAAARRLEDAVGEELNALGLAGKAFRVEFAEEEDPGSPVRHGGVGVSCGPAGWDRVQFLLAANPGEPARPLSRVGSGGEISRIMLAIHLVLQRGSEGTSRVFDEVDAGIGGSVARAVGRKLQELGRGGQVLCVTHLPQIASLAEHHFRVAKHSRAGRTEVRVEALDREGAVREVARMLGGEKVSDLSLRHAAEMVSGR
ncbi:MAG TPA: DNA repair protein RecN [Candidatus Polarisedimenticolia bacterium]|nr:DNA repair protein RecN [Candidatus Polarisedimenticolia bacterium]